MVGGGDRGMWEVERRPRCRLGFSRRRERLSGRLLRASYARGRLKAWFVQDVRGVSRKNVESGFGC